MEENKGQKQPKLTKEQSFKLDLYFWLQALVMALVSLILVFTFVGRIIGVDGQSMVPTLHHRDMLLLQSVGYTPEQGDVVVLTKEFATVTQPIVKRVIATGGQTVDIDYATGIVTVDGVALDEPYISEKALGECDMEFPYQVPENCYFMMGDHRETSIDSRSSVIGCIAEDQMVGRIFCKFWPLSEFEIMR